MKFPTIKGIVKHKISKDELVLMILFYKSYYIKRFSANARGWKLESTKECATLETANKTFWRIQV